MEEEEDRLLPVRRSCPLELWKEEAVEEEEEKLEDVEDPLLRLPQCRRQTSPVETRPERCHVEIRKSVDLR